jgi:hypothetical protein
MIRKYPPVVKHRARASLALPLRPDERAPLIDLLAPNDSEFHIAQILARAPILARILTSASHAPPDPSDVKTRPAQIVSGRRGALGREPAHRTPCTPLHGPATAARATGGGLSGRTGRAGPGRVRDGSGPWC